jgi:hypothetical protein
MEKQLAANEREIRESRFLFVQNRNTYLLNSCSFAQFAAKESAYQTEMQ